MSNEFLVKHLLLQEFVKAIYVNAKGAPYEKTYGVGRNFYPEATRTLFITIVNLNHRCKEGYPVRHAQPFW